MARKHGITSGTYDRIFLDSGAVYYGTFTDISSPGTLIGATRGGSSLSIEQEVADMAVDGALGPVKGSRRVINVVAKLTVNLIEVSNTVFNQALPGSDIGADTPAAGWDAITRSSRIAAADYIDSVTLIAEVSGMTNAAGIRLANCLVDQNLELAFADKEETVIPVTYTAHFVDTDLDTEPWFIYNPDT